MDFSCYSFSLNSTNLQCFSCIRRSPILKSLKCLWIFLMFVSILSIPKKSQLFMNLYLLGDNQRFLKFSTPYICF